MSEDTEVMERKGIFLVALLIIGGLLFAAGVMVGRGLQVKDAQPDKNRDPLARIDERDRQMATEGEDLVFLDLLRKSAGADSKLGPSPRPPVGPAPAPVAANQTLSPAQASAVPRATPSEPKSAGSPKGQGRYALQLTALRDLASAKELVAKLRSRGYADARVFEIDGKGKGPRFRVRLGTFSSQKEAQGVKSRLERQEGLKVTVLAD